MPGYWPYGGWPGSVTPLSSEASTDAPGSDPPRAGTPGSERLLAGPPGGRTVEPAPGSRGQPGRELPSMLAELAARLRSRPRSLRAAAATGIGVVVLVAFTWSEASHLDSSPAPTPGFLMQAGGGAVAPAGGSVGQAPPAFPSPAASAGGAGRSAAVPSSPGLPAATPSPAVPTTSASRLAGEPAENSAAWPIWMVRQAYAAFEEHDYAASVDLYNRILARHPADAIAHVGCAVTLLAMDQARAAEAHCRAAIRIEPRFPEAHYDLAVALHREHRDAEAAAEFRRFLALAPDDKAAPAARGFIARTLLGAPSP